jgi:hypothetical protein
MQSLRRIFSGAATLGALCIVASNAEEKPSPRPAWLSELSLSAKETYDDNVYLSGVDPKYLPSSYTVPAGSAVALENRASFVTTISPKMAVNFAALLDKESPLQVLSLGYAPDFVVFHDATSESYSAHRFTAAAKAKSGSFSLNVDNALTYVDGSEFGLTYPGGLYNAQMNTTVRERREQIQDRAAISLRYDFGKWFIRPTASLLYYDFRTAQLNVTGYQSYTDRYDANGGADFGYKLFRDAYLTLGYRYGHQYQEELSYSPYSAPSDYHRALVGIEGKPWRWLDVKVQGGPDFRSYAADTAIRITPVSDHNPVKYYAEASLAATLGANDTLTFKCKDWQWVSSIGKIPYFDSLYELAYRHALNKHLAFDFGSRLSVNDFTSANLATCRRDDAQYTINAGVTYAFNTHASLALNYAHDFGRNLQDGVVNPQTREFERNQVSLGAALKF